MGKSTLLRADAAKIDASSRIALKSALLLASFRLAFGKNQKGQHSALLVPLLLAKTQKH